MTAARPSLAYMPQLDGLRGLAVAAVVAAHAAPAVGHAVPLARLGVVLFFVLSGYLITRLLLAARDRAGAAGGWRAELGRFYARRAVRILPVYALVVGVGLALDVGAARDVWPYLVTFTTNWEMAARGEWVPGYFHFWTLAVEEQFYLVWPLVVLFAPRRAVGWAAGALVLVGPAYRGLAAAAGWNVVAVYCPTPACLDSLGAGAVAALAGRPGRAARGGWAWAAAGVAVIALARGGWPKAVAVDLVAAGAFAWAVRGAADGFGGAAGRLLAAAPVRGLGRMSYGVYVYHVFVPALVYDLPVESWPARHALAAVLMIAVPVMSWYWIEQPLLRRKPAGPVPPAAGEARELAAAPGGVP